MTNEKIRKLIVSKYIIHATDRGFWNADRKGYTLNPQKAGIYCDEESSDICSDKSRKEKRYFFNGKWHNREIKKYLKRKETLIQSAMEGMTSDQLIKMMPDLIFERRRLNG